MRRGLWEQEPGHTRFGHWSWRHPRKVHRRDSAQHNMISMTSVAHIMQLYVYKTALVHQCQISTIPLSLPVIQFGLDSPA